MFFTVFVNCARWRGGGGVGSFTRSRSKSSPECVRHPREW
jgi:hypothetical protein